MPEDAFEHPPKPRLALRVGVTGKRAIPGAERLRIRSSLSEVFDALARFLATTYRKDPSVWSPEPPLLRIMSGMAEGTDQMAAEIAVERMDSRSSEVETKFAAIAPFALDDYVNDFSNDPNKPRQESARSPSEYADAVGRFRALLGAAATEAVLEIDDQASVLNRPHGYLSLRDSLLEHSDLLVAVSDDIHGGPGGTSDVIDEAVDQHIPVIKISTIKAEIWTLRSPDPDAARQEPLEGETFEPQQQLPRDLTAELAHVVDPPAPSFHARAYPSGERGAGGRERLEQYLHEQFKPMRFGGLFRAFRDALLYAARGSPVSAAGVFLRSLRRYRVEPPDRRAAELSRSLGAEPSAAGDGAEKLRRIHAVRFAWADTLAISYADAVRSSYIAIGFLGFCAILVGVSALFVLQEMVYARLAALFVEGAIFLFLGVYFFRPAHAGRWHERMTEYRALAEALGRQRFFHALGSAERSDRTGGGTWIDWYAKATRRELGFPTTMLSAAYLRRMMEEFQREEVEMQLRYNQTIAARYGAIDRFLSRCVQLGWMITVAAAILGVVLLATLHVIKQQHWIDSVLASRAIENAGSGFAAFMIIMPILVALVYGIRQQLDFLNTAERAAATERDLTDLAMRQRALQEAPGRRAILQYIRAANDAMTDERPAWARDRGRRTPELP